MHDLKFYFKKGNWYVCHDRQFKLQPICLTSQTCPNLQIYSFSSSALSNRGGIFFLLWLLKTEKRRVNGETTSRETITGPRQTNNI